MLKVNELFYSVQGEIDIGVPAIFIRLQGCNMQPKCSFCDSSYTWDEGKEMSNEEIYNEIKEYLKVSNCIIFTGGEPMCQIDEIFKLIMFLNSKHEDLRFGIETNGLIYSDNVFIFDRISVSPKKQNYNLESLNRLNHNVTRYKFVYDNDLWFENVIKELDLEPWQIWIMPEGKTREEQLQKSNEVVEYCKKNNYRFCPRVHILIWDNRRAK